MKARAVTAQARVEMLLTVRRSESLIVTLVIPLGILVFFTKVDAVNTTLRHPVDFLVPGVLALAVMSSAMVSLGIATGYERRYGVLKRLGSTPLSRAGLLSAKTLNVLGFEVFQAIVIVATGIALGWNPSGGLFAAIGLILLGTIAFAGIGMLLAARCARRRTSRSRTGSSSCSSSSAAWHTRCTSSPTRWKRSPRGCLPPRCRRRCVGCSIRACPSQPGNSSCS